MSKSNSKPTFAIVLEALPDNGGPAAVLRLRRLLKYAGRVCRLRCTECRESNTPGNIPGNTRGENCENVTENSPWTPD